MFEPSPVDDIRANLAQIRETLACQHVDFEYRNLRDAMTEGLRTLSRVAIARPARAPLAPYADATTLLRDVRMVRDRLELGLEDGTIVLAHVPDASSALIELGRGIALHLRMTRRDTARAIAA